MTNIYQIKMTMMRAVLITLLLTLFTTEAAYPNTFEKRESAETELVDSSDEV